MPLQNIRPRAVIFVALIFLALVAVHLRWGGEDGGKARTEEEGPQLSRLLITREGQPIEIDLESLPTQRDVEELMRGYVHLLLEGEENERRTTAIQLAYITNQPQEHDRLLQLSQSVLGAVRQALLKGLNDPDARVAAHCGEALVGLWRMSDSAAAVQQFTRGLTAYETGELDAALEALTKAEKLRSPAPPDLYRMKAEVYLAKSLPDLAREQCLRALESEPRHFLALYALARSHEQKGQYEKALDRLDRALTVYKGFPPARKLREELLARKENPAALDDAAQR